MAHIVTLFESKSEINNAVSSKWSGTNKEVPEEDPAQGIGITHPGLETEITEVATEITGIIGTTEITGIIGITEITEITEIPEITEITEIGETMANETETTAVTEITIAGSLSTLVPDKEAMVPEIKTLSSSRTGGNREKNSRVTDTRTRSCQRKLTILDLAR